MVDLHDVKTKGDEGVVWLDASFCFEKMSAVNHRKQSIPSICSLERLSCHLPKEVIGVKEKKYSFIFQNDMKHTALITIFRACNIGMCCTKYDTHDTY